MKNEKLSAFNSEPIAVIGMSCRFPGAKNYHEFWNNLIGEKFSVTEIPEDRWKWQDFYGDPLKEAGKTNSKWGGFIEGIDMFDPLFFNISPKEANYIDPQHRVFLEAAWHVIEDAGYSLTSISGKKIGVYAGVSKNDYAEMLRSNESEISPFISTGTVHSILANRVSFLFNLRGKSEVIDTACSSSLVALHNAIRDIRSGDVESAIVGGVNALITPTMYLSHGKSGMLSSEGKCKTFDEKSDGYVRGEGVGCIFIKPLSKAKKDKDNILAVIGGTAVNHNGRSNSLTSPNAVAQSELISEALKKAEIDASNVSYIEAHGTATPLGDPIEVNGLKKVFGTVGDSNEKQCGLGSVKTNIGHLESASGMAGLIKVLLCIKYQKIPSTLHFQKINPYIDLENSPFYIVEELTQWNRLKTKEGEVPLTAGVSSFGMGGVNAHVVLQEFVEQSKKIKRREGNKLFEIPFSARTEKQLKVYIHQLLTFIETNGKDLSIHEIAYTMQNGRDELGKRNVFVAKDMRILSQKLEQFVKNDIKDELDDDLVNWVNGGTIDWKKRNKTKERIAVSLPGYPFEKRSCWVGEKGIHTKENTKVSVPSLFNLSKTSDNNKIKYEGTLRHSDYFIRDHVVQNECLLPGVGYFELARIAAKSLEKNSIRQIDDMFWMYPIKVQNNPVKYSIELKKEQNGNLGFEVATNDSFHAKGTLFNEIPQKSVESIDFNSIRNRCNNRKSKTEIYNQFNKEGLNYKTEFCTIEEGFFSGNEGLCLIETNAEEALLKDDTWEPALLDGIFQSVVGLCIWGDVSYEKQLLPFFLKSVKSYNSLPKKCYAYVKKLEGKSFAFDMLLCDEQGNVVMEFNEFVKREYEVEKNESIISDEEKQIESLYYTTQWIQSPLGVLGETPESILLFDTNEVLYEELKRKFPATKILLIFKGDKCQNIGKDRYEVNSKDKDSFAALFTALEESSLSPNSLIYKWSLDSQEERGNNVEHLHSLLFISQSLMKRVVKSPVKLIYLYEHKDSYDSAINRMVGGFARTLFYENPTISIFSIGIDVPSQSTINEIIFQETLRYNTAPLKEIVYQKGKREERQITTLNQPQESLNKTIFKKGGVYLISGGSGGIGIVFATHLVKTYQATVILLGRKKLNIEIERKLSQLEKLGGKAFYYSVDVSNKLAVENFFQERKKENISINGVIHAAGLIEDSFIFTKQSASLDRVITPKVYGSIHLDECTKDEPLEFFITFSSIASLMPNQGQCDYASANNFLDHFMEIRNNQVLSGDRKGVSLAFNWPLWENGGITVGEIEKEHLWSVFGMKPMANEDAISGFEKILADQFVSTLNQVVLIEGVKSKIEKHLRAEKHYEVKKLTTEENSTYQILEEIIKHVKPSINDSLSEHEMLTELGIDSMGMVTLSQILGKQLNTSLNPTFFFEYNTIAKLIGFINKEQLTLLPIDAENHYPIASLIDVEQSNIVDLVFKKRFSNDEFYMKDHIVDRKFNVPGACYIEMARQALSQVEGTVIRLYDNYWPQELSSFGNPIDATIEFVKKDGYYNYEISSNDSQGGKSIHALGKATLDTSNQVVELGSIDLQNIKRRISSVRKPDEIYASIIAEGLHVGPSFMPMVEIFVNSNEALGHLHLPELVSETFDEYVLHPSLLTGVFQTALINNKPRGIESTKYIPVAIDELIINRKIPQTCFVHTIPRESNQRTSGIKKFDAWVADIDGKVVVQLKGFSIREISGMTTKQKEDTQTEVEEFKSEKDVYSIENVEDYLKELLSDGIGLSVEELDNKTSFQEFGINSRMIIDLNQRLESVFENLSKTLFFEYGSIHDLAGYFQKHHKETLHKEGVYVQENPALGRNEHEVKEIKKQSTSIVTPIAKVEENTGGSLHIQGVENYLKELLSDGIGLGVEELDAETSFQEFGINSRMIIDLNQRLESVFENLSKTLFFEYGNIHDLANYFLNHHKPTLEGNLVVLNQKENTSSIQGDSSTIISSIHESNPTENLEKQDEVMNTDVAIIGVGGKYPEADSMSEFWDVMKKGKDCITEIPKNRFDYEDNYDGKRGEGRLYSKWGGFVNDVDKFDPLFFNISPIEAEKIDPQERLFLEVVWATLEDAGITKKTLAEQSKKVGVFVGALWQPYVNLGVEETTNGNPVAPSGLLYSIPNRVSYFFDWNGPSLAIDTACSGSLTALHYACMSIQNGESDSCIVGGVNLSLSLSKYLFLSQNNFLSTDGRCRSFGNGGDGYVPGEGVGAVLLKPLEKAIEDGDSIYGVIKGTSANHGGRTNGYTVPNPNIQGELIKTTLQKAKIDPRTISYVEAHGTGTSLGDPIEISGLCKAFEEYTQDKQFCSIGSVKSNIGHLEASAGIAGLTKILLQMKNKVLVPSIHSQELNANINFKATPFVVQHELEEWKQPQVEGVNIPLRAMLSSFGAGGSNAHAIIEEFQEKQPKAIQEIEPAIIVLSAKNQERLIELSVNLVAYLKDKSFVSLPDLAYTLQTGREGMDVRLSVVVNEVSDLIIELKQFNKGNTNHCFHYIQENDTKDPIFRGKNGQELFKTAARNKDYKTIAQLWAKGVSVKWEELYNLSQLPKRISLPTYPFARERYWIPVQEKGSKTSSIDKLHPLVHQNESNLKEQKFKTTFSGDEFFLRDHLVNHEKVLPGVAYLELVRVAGFLSTESSITQIKNIKWLSPIKVIGSPKDVFTSIYPVAESEEEFGFEVYSIEQSVEQIHSQGSICTSVKTTPSPLDAAQLLKRTSRSIDKTEHYQKLDQIGLNLGDAFQGIETLWLGEEVALSKISIPQVSEFELLPGLLDSALQTCLSGLILDKENPSLALPYSIKEVNLLNEIPSEVWCFARANEEGKSNFDIDVFNTDGKVLLTVRGFLTLTLKDFEQPLSTNKVFQTQLFRNNWSSELEHNKKEVSAEQLILVAGGTANYAELLSEELEVEVESISEGTEIEYYLRVFEKVQQKVATNSNVHITLLCENEAYLDFGFVSGLFKTAHLENNRVDGKVIGVDSLSIGRINEIITLLDEEATKQGTEVRYISGKRETKTLELASLEEEKGIVGIKENGVYLITGGMGGLGRIFATHILQTKNTTLILTGRSKLTSEKQLELDKMLNSSYEICDVTNKSEVNSLVKTVNKKYGKIDGIIHCAGLLRDRVIRQKTSLEIKEVLSSKIRGAKNLDEATKGEDMDFMVFFSSISGVLGNIGQSDYAAANAYLDNYAVYRDQLKNKKLRFGKTISINWPLWDEGGMELNSDQLQRLEKQWGMKPLPTSEGINVFNFLLRTSQHHGIVAFGELNKLSGKLLQEENTQQVKKEVVANMSDLHGKVSRQLVQLVSDLLKLDERKIAVNKELGEYGFDSILLTKFSNSLNTYYDLELLPTVFFNYPTLDSLANHLSEEYAADLMQIHGEKTEKVIVNNSEKSIVQVKEKARNRFLKPHTTPIASAPLQNEEVAIIGIGGRFPGSPDINSFWENIKNNKDLISEIPSSRWNWNEYFGNAHQEVNKTHAKWGGFIDDIDLFDPLYFNISPREAELMDPQQRIVLETVIQALEDAAISPSSLKGTNTAAFFGVSSSDYATLIEEQDDLASQAQYSTGTAYSVLVNRISYLLDIHGPSEPIDTACSSSLIAIHRAVEQINNGNCDLVIAGGVNAILSPELTLSFSKAGMLSKEGKCKTFDQSADGYVRGEGVGAIILKSKSKALEDGDPIYGIIKGTAENHGGKANTLTSPNPNAQKDLLVKAYQSAEIDPRDVSYIEAHGTGTPLGDPIEIEGLKLAFKELYVQQGVEIPENPHCSIGSIKTNIGHLEAAAGIAGIVKVLLAMKYKTLPGNTHLKKQNEYIDLAKTPFSLQRETKPWNVEGNKARVAGVSSFGFGGANAHIILEEHLPKEKVENNNNIPAIVILSAKSENQLQIQVKDLAKHLEREKDIKLHDIAYTLQVGRESREVRVAFCVNSREQLIQALTYFQQNKPGLYYQGNIREESLDFLLEGEAGEAYFQTALAKKQTKALAQLWVKGVEVDWTLLYNDKPTKINLPTYPFARERYWIPVQNKKTLKSNNTHISIEPKGESKLQTFTYSNDWQGTIAEINTSSSKATQLILLTRSIYNSMYLRVEQLSAEFNAEIVLLDEGDEVEVFLEVFEEVKRKSKSLVNITLVCASSDYWKYGFISGLFKSANKEIPNVTGKVLGIDSNAGIDTVLSLIKIELLTNDVEVRYINRNREVKKVEKVNLRPVAQGVEIKENGVYIITGGTGGLGLVFAKHLSQKKGVKIILTGRSILSPEKEHVIQQISGAVYYRCDVTKKEDVQHLIDKVKESSPTINGIIHAAGIAHVGSIATKTEAEIRKVLPAKIEGTQNIDDVTKEEELDFMILFSSISGIFGDAGLCDYASANTYLDHFAHHRSQLVAEGKRKGRTVAIDWALWKEGGMQADEESIKLLEAQWGMVPFPTEEGIHAFNNILKSDFTQGLVIYGDEANIQKSIQRTIVKKTPVKPGNKNTGEQTRLKERSIHFLKKLFAEELKLSIERLELDVALEEYGVESVMITRLTNRLNEQFENIPSTLFFECQTLEDVADFLLSTYSAQLQEITNVGGSNQKIEEGKGSRDIKSEVHSIINEVKDVSTPKKEYSSNGDVAIIGVSGKYPGADSVNQLWENLKSGKDCITKIPKDRWNSETYFDKEKGKNGKSYSKWGGFIDDVDKFDPLFFNILPRDAVTIDPQERLFLQSVWETIEDAGYTPQKLRNTSTKNGLKGNVGVYVGVTLEEYQLLGIEEQNKGNFVSPWGIPSSIANRVSYFLDLHGPSMAIDTMCSSSITAIHLACQSIKSGECELAFAGGVNLSLHPNKYLFLSEKNFVSSAGRCESFGEGGDGYVPSEGVGSVLLKPLDKAITDGDQIYGIIKGVSINHGGKSNGFTVPNIKAQAAVIHDVIDKSGVKPEDFSYIEAHGTGTSLGDPIEVAGLSKVFQADKKQYCKLGSIKSNIGHCEAAAGISGITKVLLQLKYKQLVPSLHSSTLNSKIDFKNSPFKVQQKLENWESINGKARLAGVSSFGAGGSNAHIILEEYVGVEKPVFSSNKEAIVILSAKSKERLKEKVQQLNQFIECSAQVNVHDLAFTLQLGREAMEERVAFVVHNVTELSNKLLDYLKGISENEFSGNIHKDNIGFVLDGKAGEAYLKIAIENQQTNSLAQLWVKGINIDWDLLYLDGRPTIISLPTYPFVKDRYWVTVEKDEESAEINQGKIHPLLHLNESDLTGQKFKSVYSGKEQFLTEHQVNYDKTLPSVAHLELARKAGEISVNKEITQLKNVTWVNQFQVNGKPKEVNVSIYAVEEELSYEVFSKKGAGNQLYSQGEIGTKTLPIPEKRNIEEIQKSLTKSQNKESFYNGINQLGINYGTSFQGVEHIWHSDKEVLSKISLDKDGDYVLNPKVLDCALQTCLGSSLHNNEADLSLPFQVREVNLYQELPELIWCHVRQSEENNQRQNIDLLTNQGDLVMSFIDYETLPVEDFLNIKVEE